MAPKRTDRLNSLLQVVISEVIRKDVRNPHVGEFVSITSVEITKDLQHAKVYISVIGTDEQKARAVSALQSAAGFIAVHSSKKMTIHHFPELTFKLDDSVEKQMRIENVIHKIQKERGERENKEEM